MFRNDFIVDDIASDDVKKKWNPDGDQAWMDQVQSFETGLELGRRAAALALAADLDEVAPGTK